MIDPAFKDLAARAAGLLVDLDLMVCEPYFTAADIAQAAESVAAALDRMLDDAGLTRARFLLRLESEAGMLSAYFLRGVIATLPERAPTEGEPDA